MLAESIFDGYSKESKRIRSLSAKYKNDSIADAFAQEYGLKIDTKEAHSLDVVVLELGKVYSGTVKEITKRGITFEIPGLKDEIVCKENLSNSIEAIQTYLLSHNNTLYFEVREIGKGKVIVSVLNAYYKIWFDDIKSCIKQHQGISVHIDSVIRGGYICHTVIWPLYELTQQEYTAMAFIPGSQIVLNIEKDFERWIGEDVIVVPQNFQDYVDYSQNRRGIQTKSLVCSRKKVLQIKGLQNLYNIWQEYNDKDYEGSATYAGTVTGIINSKGKTGVFVELIDEHITGLMPVNSNELLDYHPGDDINVKIKELELQEGQQPFVIKKVGKDRFTILYSNVRPVFERV